MPHRAGGAATAACGARDRRQGGGEAFQMMVSLRQPGITAPPAATNPAVPPKPPLRPGGPVVTLGGQGRADGLAEPVEPTAKSLFGPRGACLAGNDGPLFVADTGHHRLLIWRRRPETDGTPADLVIGQPDLT